MFENETLNVLSNSEVFRGLTDDELNIFFTYSQIVKFKKGDIIVKEGQIASALYVLTKGQGEVCLPKQVEDIGKQRLSEVRLDRLNSGDCFGEYSLFDSKPASASVIATQPGEVVKIAKIEFEAVLKASEHIANAIYQNIIQILVKRLRNINKEYDQVYLM